MSRVAIISEATVKQPISGHMLSVSSGLRSPASFWQQFCSVSEVDPRKIVTVRRRRRAKVVSSREVEAPARAVGEALSMETKNTHEEKE